MRILILILFTLSLGAQAKHYKLYEQFSATMGFYKLNFQCQDTKCVVMSFYKGTLYGKTMMKKDIFNGVRSNLFANFLKIEEKKEKCKKGQGISIKYYRNYGEKDLFRCFDKEDYFSMEFQKSFTKVYKSIPPPK